MARKKPSELNPELSHEHDRICAYLCAPETAPKLLVALAAHLTPVRVGSLWPSALPFHASISGVREAPMSLRRGRSYAVVGYADVVLRVDVRHRATDGSVPDASLHEGERALADGYAVTTHHVLIEVKSGSFSTGAVIRQLERYQHSSTFHKPPICYLVAPRITPAHARELLQGGVHSMCLGEDYRVWREAHMSDDTAPLVLG